MKANLETGNLQNRGVELISETPEEADMLKTIWTTRADPVMFEKVDGGNIKIVITPRIERR